MLTVILLTVSTMAAVAVVAATAATDLATSTELPSAGNGALRIRLPNFYAADVLTDGESERRFFYDGVAAKETSAIYTFNGTKEGAILRQMSNKGRHLIQLIYDANQRLQDCEYVDDRQSIVAFLEAFSDEYRLMTDAPSASSASSASSANNEKTLIVRSLDSRQAIPADMAGLLDYRSLKRQCRQLHRQMKQNGLNETGQGESSSRRKRDVMMMVGTKWCGSGNRASKESDLGTEQGLDRCCRIHDHCPMTIRSQNTKYEFTNHQIITISHCDCDQRFRSCLKQANTAASNLVGKLFFNIIQTKCFVLKPEKVCKKTSWWGKCQQTELKKKAHLRDPLPY